MTMIMTTIRKASFGNVDQVWRICWKDLRISGSVADQKQQEKRRRKKNFRKKRKTRKKEKAKQQKLWAILINNCPFPPFFGSTSSPLCSKCSPPLLYLDTGKYKYKYIQIQPPVNIEIQIQLGKMAVMVPSLLCVNKAFSLFQMKKIGALETVAVKSAKCF